MGESNQQGVLLDLVLRRCDPYVASLADFASGPVYTYSSGSRRGASYQTECVTRLG